LTILQKPPKKFNVFGIVADTPGGGGGTARAIHFIKFFSRATFALLTVRLYLASFMSYKASQMTSLENVARTMQHIWNYGDGLFTIFSHLFTSFHDQHLPGRQYASILYHLAVI